MTNNSSENISIDCIIDLARNEARLTNCQHTTSKMVLLLQKND